MHCASSHADAHLARTVPSRLLVLIWIPHGYSRTEGGHLDDIRGSDPTAKSSTQGAAPQAVLRHSVGVSQIDVTLETPLLLFGDRAAHLQPEQDFAVNAIDQLDHWIAIALYWWFPMALLVQPRNNLLLEMDEIKYYKTMSQLILQGLHRVVGAESTPARIPRSVRARPSHHQRARSSLFAASSMGKPLIGAPGSHAPTPR